MTRTRRILFWCALSLVVAATRLTHARILWIEECYPAAGALNLLAGRALYGDFWYDKPPLAPLLYALLGVPSGVALRLAGAGFVMLCAWLLYAAARRTWGETEGCLAALFCAFYLTFGIPSAVLALAPDLLMLAPHAAAVFALWCGRPVAAGALAGLGFLLNPKGLLLLPVCVAWMPAAWWRIVLGFAVAAIPLAFFDRAAYLEQVWRWGRLYASDTFVSDPFSEGLRRTVQWMGFAATLVLGAWLGWRRDRDRTWLIWIALCLVGVAAGWRFAPRYYFLLLPPLILLAARGLAVRSRWRTWILALLLVPLARFGPRYVQLARDGGASWQDLALYHDSREAALLINELKSHGDTLFVWGYRPDIDVLTRLPGGAPYLESQPLTGVFADRHLASASPSATPDSTATHRRRLANSRPTFVVDGLGPLNPRLAITAYTDLRPWLANYREVARTRTTILYRRTQLP
ncbi:MAG: hypothetical protein FJW40_06335 [Acidobacteria bacterium]|nr:hypothetical protein [Acidobacteriota bacterium]